MVEASLQDRLKRLSTEQRERLLRQLKEQRGTTEQQTIPVRPPGGPALLSFGQRRLWFIDRLAPGSAAYNVPVAVRLEAPVDPVCLQGALFDLTRRHRVMRGRFRLDGDSREPVQEERSEALPRLARVDLDALLEERRDEEAHRLAEGFARQPFDLSSDPLVRAVLLRHGAAIHDLVITLHHIVSDGWSDAILLRELTSLYAARAAGRRAALPELPIQYADFAAWQRRTLEEEGALDQALTYWKRRMSPPPPVLQLPTDRLRSAVRDDRGGLHRFVVPSPTTEGLRELAREEGATLFMVLLAAFQVLLSRYSGQEDVVVGTPVANRRLPEIEPLIGFFINTLALRTRVDGEEDFRSLLRRVRSETLEAYEHQDLPFELLMEELELARDLSHTPLFQVMLALGNADPGRGPGTGGGLPMSPLPLERRAAKFDLTLVVDELPDRLRAELEYSRALFDPATVERLTRHLLQLLESVVADPDRPVLALPLLDEGERLQRVRATAPEIRQGAGRCLHQRFLERAGDAASATAVVCGDETWSYGRLAAVSAALAERLRQAGVGPEVRVGLHLQRAPLLVAGILAVLRAGGAYVPLDPSYPAERLAWMLEDSGARVVLSEGAVRDQLPDHGGPVLLADQLAAEPGTGDGAADHPAVALTNAAYVIYTSGSTGRPKGVVVPHANVDALFAACDRHFDFGPGDVWTLFHSCSFDFSVWELWGALLYGGSLVVVDDLTARSPERFLELLAEQGVTVLSQTPSAFHHLVQAEERYSGPDLALRWVVFGGEALDFTTLVPWLARHGDDSPRLINMYGITETTVHVTWRRVRREDVAGGSRSAIGTALPHLSLHVLDRWGEPVPELVAGELHVGGAGAARGYLGRPALTADRFRPDPFGSAGGRLYRTGDLARWRPGGDVEYLGRIDHQVKVRGFRIELGEIEAQLAEHPAVARAVLAAWQQPDEPFGSARLAAYVVPADAAEPDAAELRAFLADRLPDYMVPAFYTVLPFLPLTENGKVDRRRLPEPEAGRDRSRAPYVAPRTEAEEVLAAVWGEVLEVDEVGIDDDFFALGGDSMRTVQVLGRLRQQGWNLDLRDLYSNPTIRALAPLVSRDEKPEMEAVENEEDRVRRLLEQVEGMSAEEAERVLAAEAPEAEKGAGER